MRTAMTTYEFTAFDEQTLLDAGSGNGRSIGCGDTFTMPGGATTCFSVSDNDRSLSGDGRCWGNEQARDWYGQTASITDADSGEELGNGRQIYAERYFWVSDQNGNWYVMLEIEQEGTNDDYFAFYTGHGYAVPPEGAELTVHSSGDVRGNWVKFDSLDAGDKSEPATGALSGRYFCDDDADGLDNDGADNGIAGIQVILLDTDGAQIATTTTGADGSYAFTDLQAGVYSVQFVDTVSGKVLTTQDAGNNGNDGIDSDAADLGNGISEIRGIEVLAGETTQNNDAGVRNPAEFATEKDFISTDEDTPLDFNVLDNDTPSEGAMLNVIFAGAGSITFNYDEAFEFTSFEGRTGMLEISRNGDVSFDPASGFEDLNAGDTDLIIFGYAAQDSSTGEIAGEDVVITINGIDDMTI